MKHSGKVLKFNRKIHKYHKEIAPRLFSGERREHYVGGLPPEIKQGLRLIAQDEKQSVSWVLEQIIIKFFKFKQPKYVERKQPTTKRQVQQLRHRDGR